MSRVGRSNTPNRRLSGLRKEGVRHNWQFISRVPNPNAIELTSESWVCFRCDARRESWHPRTGNATHRARYRTAGGEWRSKCPPCERENGGAR